MSFPNRGKSFPGSRGGNRQVARGSPASDSTNFANAMSVALNRAFEGNGSKIKTVAKLTGANERTVKNWFSGAYGPNGAHLVVLVRHSDEVLNVFLAMAGREKLLDLNEITNLEARLIGLLGRRDTAAGASPGTGGG